MKTQVVQFSSCSSYKPESSFPRWNPDDIARLQYRPYFSILMVTLPKCCQPDYPLDPKSRLARSVWWPLSGHSFFVRRNSIQQERTYICSAVCQENIQIHTFRTLTSKFRYIPSVLQVTRVNLTPYSIPPVTVISIHSNTLSNWFHVFVPVFTSRYLQSIGLLTPTPSVNFEQLSLITIVTRPPFRLRYSHPKGDEGLHTQVPHWRPKWDPSKLPEN